MSSVSSPSPCPPTTAKPSLVATSAISLTALAVFWAFHAGPSLGRVSTTAWVILLAGLTGALAGGCLAVRFARARRTRRLGGLCAAVEALAQGNLSAQIEGGERSDAVGALARAIENLREKAVAQGEAQDTAAAQRVAAAERRHDVEMEVARTGRALAVGEFAALIAHEIRQPIAAILLNCSAATNYMAQDEIHLGEARAALARIRRDADRAGAVIQGIRAMLTNTHPDYAAVDLNDMLEESLSFLGEDLRLAQVTLMTDLSREVPLVWGDRGQLQQVVLNLVSNAIEAMTVAPGRKRVLVVGTALMDEHAAMVSVRDSGGGLDPKVINRLFDPLFTTRRGGIGLGLSISRSIIEAHGGRLWATQAKPRGACFSFTLQSASSNPAFALASAPRVAALVPLALRKRAHRHSRVA